jgi:hypothetical protein
VCNETTGVVLGEKFHNVQNIISERSFGYTKEKYFRICGYGKVLEMQKRQSDAKQRDFRGQRTFSP